MVDYVAGKSPLEYLSEIQEAMDASGFMNDEELDDAMGNVIKLVAKPDVPPQTAAHLVVQLEAWSALFKIKARSLMMLPVGNDPAKRKGFYLSLADSLQRLADALKYSTRI
jgi:hypothetical protein